MDNVQVKNVKIKKSESSSEAFNSVKQMFDDRVKIYQLALFVVKYAPLIVAALIFSLALNFYLGFKLAERKVEYFATEQGRFLPLIPMSTPYASPGNVIQFSRDTLIKSFTMDFSNWRAGLENVRVDYTKDGFKSFIDSLQSSGILNKVRKDRMNLTIAADAGVLTREGIDNGVYVWYVEVPIRLRLVGQTTQMPEQRFLATVRIERVPTIDSVKGIAVGQIVTKPL